MGKSVVILGSSRSHGNTRRVVDEYLKHSDGVVIDLNNYKISYFDYEHDNKDDDFIPLIEKLLEYDSLVFATPVYWYSMSAIMKTFFDRISDLLKIRKDLGRRFKGKSMKLLVCSSDSEVYDWFHKPFEATAEYMDMEYKGMLWTWVENEEVPLSIQQAIKHF